MQTTAISAMISQAAALPTQVLKPSIVWRKRSTVMSFIIAQASEAPPGLSGGASQFSPDAA
jgi:hypothetical protein